jgi:hypothetical protein
MIPKKPAPYLMGGGKRFSEKIMLHQISYAVARAGRLGVPIQLSAAITTSVAM